MLLDLLEETLPEWMFQPARAQWSTLMATVALGFDFLVEGVYQARLAAMPGQVDTSVAPNMGGFLAVDALGHIGRDRRIRRGLAERPEAYALRLRQWLQAWSMAGTPWGLLQELAAVLQPGAGILRIVTAGGEWWTLGTDGSITWQLGANGWSYNPSTGALSTTSGTAHAWNWDSNSNPAPYDQNDPGRIWVICYAPLNSPYELTTDLTFNDAGVVDDFWNATGTSGAGASPNAGVVGLSAPIQWVDLVRHVVSDWKAAGIAATYLIVSFDPTAFDPTTDSTPTSVPDGTWAWHGWLNPTTWLRSPTRFPSAEYVPAGPSGVRP